MTNSITDASHESWRARGLGAIVVIVWSGVLGIAAFLPAQRLWGINYLAFAAPNVWALFALLTVAALVLVFDSSLMRFVRKILSGFRTRPRLQLIALLLMVGVGSWVLRAREALLGDGTLRVTDALLGVYWYVSEIIPTVITSLLATALPVSIDPEGLLAYRLVAIIASVFWIAGLWWLLPKVTDSRRTAILWLITFGSIRFLAGYVETYTLPFVCLSLATVAALAYVKGRIHGAWVVGLWSLAVASHITALALFPLLVCLFTRGPTLSSQHGPTQTRATHIVLLGVAATVAGVIVAMFVLIQGHELGSGTTSIVLPVIGHAPHHYGLISPAHVVDAINQWLLMAPAVCAAVVFWLSGYMESRHNEASESGVASHRLFWLLAAIVPLAAGFALDPRLGWARDWDLMALLSAPALVGLALWLDRLHGAPRRAALGVAIISASLWLSFSVDGRAERRRFESLLDLDQSRSDYGHEIMAQYYRRNNDLIAAITHYKKALDVTPDNQRYRVNIAVCYYDLKRYDEAVRWYQRVIDEDPNDIDAMFRLGHTYNVMGRYAEAVETLTHALSLVPDDPGGSYELALALFQSGRAAEALPYFEKATHTQQVEAFALNRLALCHLVLDQADTAAILFDRALELNPNVASAWLNAADAQCALRDTTKMRRMLEGYERLVSVDQRVDGYYRLVDSLVSLTTRR